MGRSVLAVQGAGFGVALALAATSPGLAQVGPSAVAPTREELREQLTPQIAPSPETGVIGPLDGAEQPLPGLPESSASSFVLRGLSIENATVYPDAALRTVYEPFIGTDVTLGGLREIANRIEALYSDDGYVATRVIIPPQTIADGVATLEVYEGTIIHYEINGEIGPVRERIASLLDNLLTGRPARWSELERYLLLARDLPGISLTGTLRSAGDTAPGGVILVVDTARKAADGFLSLQNRNSEATGTFALSGGGALNANTRFAERIGAAALLALEVPEEVSGYLIYEQSLGNEGLRGRISGIQSFSEPQDLLADLSLTTETTLAAAELEYPMVRSRRFSLWTRGGVEYEDQRTSFGEDDVELFDDQLTVLYAGARGIWLPPLGGLTQLDAELRQGLDDFGASATSKPDASVDFTLVRGTLSHRQPVPPFFELFAEVRGQKSNEPLPNLEEMPLGELTIGRGYEPGSLIGDNGFAGTLELRYFPPGLEAWWLNSLHVYTFLDYGRIYDFGNPTLAPEGYEDLASAGFGMRFQLFDTLYGDFYYAQPMTRALSTAERRPEGGVKFALTKYF
jgi:hemolysin activation/secretion protein